MINKYPHLITATEIHVKGSTGIPPKQNG